MYYVLQHSFKSCCKKCFANTVRLHVAWTFLHCAQTSAVTWSFVSIRECAYLINKLKSFKLLCSFYIQKLLLMKRLRMPLVLDLVKPEELEENNKERMSTDCYCIVGKLTCLEIKF